MPSRKKPAPAVLSDFTRQQAAVYLNIGLAKLDELVRDNVLQSYKLGISRRAGRRITRESVELLRRGRPAKPHGAEDPRVGPEAGQ